MTDENLISVIKYKEGDTINFQYVSGSPVNEITKILE